MTATRVAAAVVILGIALLGITRLGGTRNPDPERIAAWNAEIARLQAEQDSLRARAAALVAADERIQSLPEGEVVVAVPTAFVRSVVARLFEDVASNVTLSLGGIKAHAQKKVKKIVTIGEFTVDVDITRVVGRLRPGKPGIAFGGDSVSLSLPVTIAEGRGEATIHFVWDGRNVADLTCGDLDITQEVTGTVIPDDYLVTGALHLRVSGRQVLATLRFPETRLRIRVKPSKESWDAIHAILEEKKGVCGWVLEKVDVPQLLTNLTSEKGFNVKLPIDKIRPLLLPAGIRDSVSVGGRTLAVA
ncbi:MAG TPA: hypothetical protein VFP58_13700, partial [Candidatus Eisenbacteria bacterium]|nr:hypothetical protein [Candidatus Eisenbacteria bacterium]